MSYFSRCDSLVIGFRYDTLSNNEEISKENQLYRYVYDMQKKVEKKFSELLNCHVKIIEYDYGSVEKFNINYLLYEEANIKNE